MIGHIYVHMTRTNPIKKTLTALALVAMVAITGEGARVHENKTRRVVVHITAGN